MKKILQLTKAIILTLAAVIMLLNTNVLTVYAQVMLPGMTKTEYGILVPTSSTLTIDRKEWVQNSKQPGYPYREVVKTYTKTLSNGMTRETEGTFLDCYLTDYIKTHEESEWPSFVIKGTDGVPFYLTSNDADTLYFVKWCYDEKSGWWIKDNKYQGTKVPNYGWSDAMLDKAQAEIEQMIEDLKEDIANGDVIENGKLDNPIIPDYVNDVIDSESPDAPTENLSGSTGDDDKDDDDKPEEPVNPPAEDPEIKDPYADVNTLGATVTLKTDCIKVKSNKKGVVAQKPLPSAVKVNNKALKRNKTFTVSYEKYTDDWNAVDAVTDEGIYRLVITGKNGYEGVYKKRLYVTADKTIKAMSSVAVKVNKVAYTGEPITTGVIKTAKIGKRTLVEGTDYTVTYKNNTDSGIGQVILTAKDGSGLLGTKTVNFTITGNKITKAKVEGLKALTYSPNTEMVQNIKLTYGGTTLTEGKDYTVSYINNTKAGTAKITFTGKGLYNGTLTKTFKINKAPLSENMLDNASKKIEMTYTGKALNPEVTLKIGDKTLKKGTDYTLTYKNNVKVSTADAPAQITVKGKGNYTGSFKVDFTVIAKSNGVDEKSNAKSIKSDEEDDNLTEDGAIVDEPTTDEPVTDETTEEEPATDEPTEEEPVTDEPTEEEPVTDETTEEEPATDKPTGDKPVTDEPTEEEPTTDDPTEEEPVTDEPTEDKPVTDEPTEDESVTDEPTEDDPVTDEPATEDTVADEPTVDDLTTNECIIADIDTETTSTVETTTK